MNRAFLGRKGFRPAANNRPGGFTPILTEDKAVETRVRSMLAKQGLKLGNFIAYFTLLAFTINVNANTNSYTVSMKRQASDDFPTNVGLEDSDTMFVCGMKVQLNRRARSGSGVLTPGNTYGVCYVDPDIFATTSEQSALESVYRGNLTVKTSSTTRFEIRTDEFRYVPITQKGVASGATTEPSTGGSDQNSRGFYTMTPELILDGSENNTIQFQLGNATLTNIDGALTSGGAESNFRNVIEIHVRGFLVKNLSQKQGRFMKSA